MAPRTTRPVVRGASPCDSDCPSGQTFPSFDLAGPYLAADNMHGTLVMAFEAAQPSGQGQIEYAFSADGGATWSAPALLAPSPRAPVLRVADGLGGPISRSLVRSSPGGLCSGG